MEGQCNNWESLGEIWVESGNSWDEYIQFPEWLRRVDVFQDAIEQPRVACSRYMGLGEIWVECKDKKSWEEYIPFPQWIVDMDMFF